MKKIFLSYILILVSICLVASCAPITKNNQTKISGHTMDYRIEAIEDDKIRESITIKLDTNKYNSYAELNEDKTNILLWLELDAGNNLHYFTTLASQSSSLKPEIIDEYTHRNPITYEAKNVNGSNMIQFDMVYKNANIRQVWYAFIWTFDGSSGLVLDYNDPEIFGNGDASQSTANDDVKTKEGTWFNKSYIEVTTVYDYAFDPYPTFVHSFVTNEIKYPNITYTQTQVSSYDDLKTNAIKETVFKGGIVERTWIVNVNTAKIGTELGQGAQIEYYMLQANRVSWYILALCLTLIFVMILLFVAVIKTINKKRNLTVG